MLLQRRVINVSHRVLRATLCNFSSIREGEVSSDIVEVSLDIVELETVSVCKEGVL
jgi:hypothetical protein